MFCVTVAAHLYVIAAFKTSMAMFLYGLACVFLGVLPVLLSARTEQASSAKIIPGNGFERFVKGVYVKTGVRLGRIYGAYMTLLTMMIMSFMVASQEQKDELVYWTNDLFNHVVFCLSQLLRLAIDLF